MKVERKASSEGERGAKSGFQSVDHAQEFRFYSDFKVSFQERVMKSFVLHGTSWQQCGGRISWAELEEGTG